MPLVRASAAVPVSAAFSVTSPVANSAAVPAFATWLAASPSHPPTGTIARLPGMIHVEQGILSATLTRGPITATLS